MELSEGRFEEIIAQVRAVQAKVAPAFPEDASDGADDDMHGALEDRDEDREFLRDMLAGIGEVEIKELTALMWIGRGDYEPQDWELAVQRVDEDVDIPLPDYLVQVPLLAEYASDGRDRVRDQGLIQDAK